MDAADPRLVLLDEPRPLTRHRARQAGLCEAGNVLEGSPTALLQSAAACTGPGGLAALCPRHALPLACARWLSYAWLWDQRVIACSSWHPVSAVHEVYKPSSSSQQLVLKSPRVASRCSCLAQPNGATDRAQVVLRRYCGARGWAAMGHLGLLPAPRPAPHLSMLAARPRQARCRAQRSRDIYRLCACALEARVDVFHAARTAEPEGAEHGSGCRSPPPPHLLLCRAQLRVSDAMSASASTVSSSRAYTQARLEPTPPWSTSTRFSSPRRTDLVPAFRSRALPLARHRPPESFVSASVVGGAVSTLERARAERARPPLPRGTHSSSRSFRTLSSFLLNGFGAVARARTLRSCSLHSIDEVRRSHGREHGPSASQDERSEVDALLVLGVDSGRMLALRKRSVPGPAHRFRGAGEQRSAAPFSATHGRRGAAREHSAAQLRARAAGLVRDCIEVHSYQ